MDHITPIDASTYYCQESNSHDDIYNGVRSVMDSFPTIQDDKDYQDTDYKLNVFSTMGDNLKAVYQNNVVTPIRSKHTLTALGTKFNIKGNSGVYIVETFTASTTYGINSSSLMEYYLNSNNVTIGDRTREEIKKYVNKNKQGFNKANPIVLRFFTFIPDEVLYNDSSVYIENHNLVITRNDYTCIPSHPWSKTCLEHDSKIRVLKQQAPNVISIDITNNNNPSKPYWISIGNQVHKLTSSADGITKDGIKFVFKKNGTVANTSDVPLNELSNFGIYETHDDAMYNGDPKLKLEYAKYKLDLDKISSDHDAFSKKMAFEKEKLEHERDRATQELAKSKEQYKLDMAKMKHEREMLVSKALIDSLSNMYKLVGLNLEIHRNEQKHQFDTEITKLKHQLEVSRSEQKHQNETDKSFSDMISKTTLAAVTLAKAMAK